MKRGGVNFKTEKVSYTEDEDILLVDAGRIYSTICQRKNNQNLSGKKIILPKRRV